MTRQRFLFVAILFFLFSALPAQSRQTTSYSGVTEIELATVSGDCTIERGQGNQVSVEVDSTFGADSYEAEIEQRGNRLILKERFFGRSNSGRSNWTLFVPDDVRISFSSASGDFEINGVRADLEVRTASGDIQISDVAGRLEASSASGNVIGVTVAGILRFSSASGNVEVEGSSGEFELSSASGSVRAHGLSFEAESSFSSASGDARLSLAASPQFDLKVSSASGDAILEVDGTSVNAFVEVTARKGRNIEAPFAFDSEETIYRWNQEYVRKSVSLGSGGPLIEVSTASGRAEVR